MKKVLLLIIFIFIGFQGFNQTSQRAIDRFKGRATGTDTYAVTINDVTSVSYYDGQKIWVQFNNANTGASTLNLNSIGALPITLSDAALTSGQITDSVFYGLVFNFGKLTWQMGGSGGGGGIDTIYRKTATDSVFYDKAGTTYFAFIDSSGSTVDTLNFWNVNGNSGLTAEQRYENF